MSILEKKNENNDDYLKDYHEITEQDFYPPEDGRIYTSGVKDIIGGDNFEEYAEWFWDTYENHLFD